ncbi:MAG: GNAT family N-acetyltransferase, partial [Deltaproteobacteria bacterium]|nr:GNAT family N-acetyltransferase [Deltaproteobacteria bacterium]
MVRIQIDSTIDALDPQKWDQIVERDHIVSRHAYLKAIERAEINDCQFRYVTLQEGDRILAHTCVYSMTFPLDLFNGGLSKKAVDSVRTLWPRFLSTRFVECGTPVALGHTFSFAPDGNVRTLLSFLLEGIETVACSFRHKTILVRDFIEGDLGWAGDSFPTKGYGRVPNLPNTFLEIRWHSFDEYLASLKSKYRNEAKNHIMRAQKNSIRFENRANFENLAGELTRLWHQTYERPHEYRREILTPKYFEAMDSELGSQSGVLLAWKGVQLVGFSLYLLDDDTLRWQYSGMDYEVSREASLYFNLMYQLIELAIAAGKKAIEMGITSYSPKLQVGAAMEPLQMYLRHTSPLWHPVVVSLWRSFTKLPKGRISKEVFCLDPPTPRTLRRETPCC